MAVNHTYDELAGHAAVVGPMAEAKPLWRSALLGAYIELVSVMMRSAVAACEGGAANDDVEGIVSLGDIIQIEPWATKELIDGLIHYRYLEDLGAGRYRLQPYKRLIHWKRPEQVAREKAKRADVKDPVLRAAVRFRDGDQCRICHEVVKWGAEDSDPLRGTMDHKIPGVLADGNPDMLAVACGRCNGIRSNRADADEIAPWQPEPEHPYYTARTASYLRQHHGHKGLHKTGEKYRLPVLTITPRPVVQADTAPRDPAPSGTTRTSETPANGPQSTEPVRPGSQPDNAPTAPRPVVQADTAPRDPAPSGTTRTIRPETDPNPSAIRSTDSDPDPPDPRTNHEHEPTPPTGRGREGNGLDGTGGAWAGQRGPDPPTTTKPRRRRARRGKSRQPTKE